MSSVTRGSAPSLSAVIHSKYNKAIEKGNLFCGGYRFEAFVEGCDRNEDAGIAGLKCQLFIAGGLANKTWFYTFEGFAENNQMIVRIDETLAASIPIPPPIIRETDDEYLEQGLDPFLDPDPELTIGPVGTSHILILNKYCVLPRQLLLVSNGFQSQDEPLRFTDFCGLASTLKELKKSRDAGEHIVFYNCGRASGASQAHKHIQIVERPTELQKLFPEELNMDIDSKAPYSHPSIPFEHYILPVPPNPQPGVLHSIYNTLLTSCSFAILRANPLANPNTNHNLIITPKFMMAVPRLLPAYKDIGANSLSLLGIIWVKDEGEAGLWREEGVMTILTKVTIPRKGWRQENNYGGLEATEGRHGSMMTWLKRGDSDGDAMSIMSASSWDNSSGVDSDF